jgi:hypothetical protein
MFNQLNKLNKYKYTDGKEIKTLLFNLKAALPQIESISINLLENPS